MSTLSDVKDAVVAKASASAGLAAAGLRGCDDDPADPRPTPWLKIGNPLMEPLDIENANVSEFIITLPWELIVPWPAGRKRSNPIAAEIVWALFVEWRSGIGLGLSGTVVGSRIGSAERGLREYADLDMDGYNGTIVVQLYLTHSARTF